MATEDPEKPKPKISLAAKLALAFGIGGAGATALFNGRYNPPDTAVVAAPEQPPTNKTPDPGQPDNKWLKMPPGGGIVPGKGYAKSNPSSNTRQLEEAPKSELIILSTDGDLSNANVEKLLGRLSIRKRWTGKSGKEVPCVILDTTGVEYKAPDMLDFEKGTGPVTIMDTGAFEEGYAAYWRNPSSPGGHFKIAQSDGTFSPAAFNKAGKYLTGKVPPEIMLADEEVQARMGNDPKNQEWKMRLDNGTLITLRISTVLSKVPIPTEVQTPGKNNR